MFLKSIPELSHIEEFRSPPSGWNGSVQAYVTLTQRVGLAFRLPPIDAEANAADSAQGEIARILSKLKPGVALKIISKTIPSHEYAWESSRRAALQKLGFITHQTFILAETAPRTGIFKRLRFSRSVGPGAFQAEMDFLNSALDWSSLSSLGAKGLSAPETEALFPVPGSELVRTRHGMELGDHHLGIVRLWRQGTGAIDPESLTCLREQLPAPYQITVAIRKLPEVRSQYFLRRLRGQKAISQDSVSGPTLESTENALEATELQGQSLIGLEWILVLKRQSETELKEDMELCSRTLAALGDVIQEVHGAVASWISTLPGTEPHHEFLELESIAPLYAPTLIRGEPLPATPPPRRALPLHRRDGSLYHFDLFREGYDGANLVINGRRGKGKSVLANLISSSLLEDPQIRMIKVDVGGSYVKECEMNQGAHVQFNLSEPSGLNPFGLLRAVSHTSELQDSAVILATFLGSLILESKETVISKELQGALESAVLAYANSGQADPSLSDFLRRKPDVPRIGLLERFSTGGVFSNVLKSRPDSAALESNRYVYFNFERLQNAANEDFSQAVMATVIATVNLEVLKAGDARRGSNHRVVFFADEVPFFIQRNGRFFKLTTANFRKFGHGTVLIAQTTLDFMLPKEGGGMDAGILVNSPIRGFYQIDDSSETFRERFGLTSVQLGEIQGLSRTESYREVFLQDELGGRVLRVAVTPEEYWRVTSSRSDNEKLYALMNAVPGLKLEEAIRCLSL